MIDYKKILSANMLSEQSANILPRCITASVCTENVSVHIFDFVCNFAQKVFCFFYLKFLSFIHSPIHYLYYTSYSESEETVLA